jgi:hypothetical protein
VASDAVARAATPLLTARQRLAPGVGLAAVSCATARACIALTAQGRASVYDGKRWSDPRAAGRLPLGPGRVSVSCATAVLCVAAPNGSNTVSVWNGRTWTGATALPGAVGIEAVGCSSSGYCAAVDGEGNAYAFSDGAWQRTVGDWGSVAAISCVAGDFCVSAGPSGLSAWNGARWTQPDSLGVITPFTGVSCSSRDACTAVDAVGQAFRWDGSAWSKPLRIEPGPSSRAAFGPSPSAVACATATFCVAVDGSGAALERDAGRWSRRVVDASHALTAVSCPSAAFCAATDSAGTVLFGRA